MRFSLSVRPEAEADALEAARWYQEQAENLGIDFLDGIHDSLDAIEANPLLFPQVSRSTRRAIPRRFPYGIYFKIQENRVRVLAVLHLARDPRIWQERTK